MSNQYLIKAASIYEYWKNVSGKDHHDLKARKFHLEKALANGDTPESLSKAIHSTGKKMFRARAQGLAGLSLAAGGAIYGAKKYSDSQNELAKANMMAMLHKEAALDVNRFWSTIRASSRPIARGGKAVIRTFNSTLKAGVDKVNTAHGGKVKEYGVKNFGVDTKAAKDFGKADPRAQLRQAYRAGAKKAAPGPKEGLKARRKEGGKAALKEVADLHKKQKVAKVGVYGTAGAVAYAHSKGKEKGRVEATRQMYY